MKKHCCAVCDERTIPCTRGTGEGCYVCDNGPDICEDCHTRLVESSCIGCRVPPMYCECAEEELVFYDHPIAAETLPTWIRDEDESLAIGSTITHFAGAPGTGRIVYEVVSMEPFRAVVVSNTIRELSPYEVV